MCMRKLIQRALNWGKEYKPLITISISRNAIFHNINEFKKLNQEKSIIPVLKSNAYGHGLELVSELLDNFSFPFFAVDTYYEALLLRRAGIKTKILIIGYSYSDTILNDNLKNVSYSITSLDALMDLIKDQTKNGQKNTRLGNLHLKIDTGMKRQGFNLDEIDETIKILKKYNIVPEGIFTHFADADSENPEFTLKQIENWNNLVDLFKSEFFGTNEIKFFHASASAGSVYSKNIKGNITRLGLGLYGISPSNSIDNTLDLKPALEMRTVITAIKNIKKGEKVGYNGTFTAEHNMTIATLPIGYNEGLDRRLSNNGFVKIKNNFAPIIGRVSMNISSIDISRLNSNSINDQKNEIDTIPSINEPVIIFSSKKSDKNSIQNVAKLCGTIPYEILTGIPAHLRRTLVD